MTTPDTANSDDDRRSPTPLCDRKINDTVIIYCSGLYCSLTEFSDQNKGGRIDRLNQIQDMPHAVRPIEPLSVSTAVCPLTEAYCSEHARAQSLSNLVMSFRDSSR